MLTPGGSSWFELVLFRSWWPLRVWLDVEGVDRRDEILDFGSRLANVLGLGAGEIVKNVPRRAAFAFYRVGTWGIPLAISLANVAASAALFVLLRRRLGRIDFGAIASSFLRIAVASAVTAAAAYGVWRGLDEVLGRGIVMQAISLLTALFVAAVVYLLAARALRVRELEALLALRRRRGAP